MFDSNFDGATLLDRHVGGVPNEELGGVPEGFRAGSVVTNASGGRYGGYHFGMFDQHLRRPYLQDRGPNRGKECIIVNRTDSAGRPRYTVEKGVRSPVREEVAVHNIMMSPYVPMHIKKTLTMNATAMRKEEWIMLDQAILREARLRPRFYADVASVNTYGGFNGMSKMILEHEVMSDPGAAVVDMEGVAEGQADRPQFQLRGVPLPITHCDFYFTSRQLAVSRNSGTPLDSTMGEAAGRRVTESVERTAIGVDTGVTYGGNSTQVGGYDMTSSVYGALNYSDRIVTTGTTQPTHSGWTPNTTVNETIAQIVNLLNNRFYGPFMIYYGIDWDKYMNQDYIVLGGAGGVSGLSTLTLRQRLQQIPDVQDVRRLDFMRDTATPAGDAANITTTFPFRMFIVQMTGDVVRAVNGMDITTVQWEEKGGLMLRFKVMCIQLLQVRSTYAHYCGINDVQATVT